MRCLFPRVVLSSHVTRVVRVQLNSLFVCFYFLSRAAVMVAVVCCQMARLVSSVISAMGAIMLPPESLRNAPGCGTSRAVLRRWAHVAVLVANSCAPRTSHRRAAGISVPHEEATKPGAACTQRAAGKSCAKEATAASV